MSGVVPVPPESSDTFDHVTVSKPQHDGSMLVAGVKIKSLMINGKLILMAFGLRECSFCLYGLCAKPVHFINLNASAIAEKIKSHIESCSVCRVQKVSKDEIIRALLNGFLESPHQTSVERRCGVLFPKCVFEVPPMQVIPRQCGASTKGSFCKACLGFISDGKSQPCCENREPILISCYKQKYADGIPFLGTEEDVRQFKYNQEQIQANIQMAETATLVAQMVNITHKCSYHIEQLKSNAQTLSSIIQQSSTLNSVQHGFYISPSPNPCSQPSNSMNVQQSLSASSVPSNVHQSSLVSSGSYSQQPLVGAIPHLDQSSPSTSASTPLTQRSYTSSSSQTPFPQPNFGSRHSPTPVAHATSIRPMNPLMNKGPQFFVHHGNGMFHCSDTGDTIFMNEDDRKLSHALVLKSGYPTSFNSLLDDPSLAQAIVTANGNTSFALNSSESGSIASRQMQEILWGSVKVTDEMRIDLQESTVPFNKRNDNDALLYRGVMFFLRFSLVITLEKLNPGVPLAFNQAIFNNARGEREEHGIVALRNGYPTAIGLSQERDIASLLVRILRCAIQYKYPGYLQLVSALSDVRAANAPQTMATLEQWNISGLAMAIAHFFYYIVIHQSQPNIHLLFRPFVFKSKSSAQSPSDHQEDNEEGDDEDSFDEALGGSMNDLGFNRPSFICKLMSATIRAAKLSTVISYTHFVREQELKIASCTQSGFEFADPYAVVKEQITSSTNMNYLAQLSNKVSRIIPAHVSQMNTCELKTGTLGEPIIHLKGNMFNMSAIRKCGSLILENIRYYVVACCGLEQSPTQSRQLWDKIIDPNDASFRIIPLSSNMQDCARLSDEGCTIIKEKCASVNGKTLVHHANELRESIFAGIALFMGGIARSPELQNLVLSQRQGHGNLFLNYTWYNQPTLAFADLVQKTYHEAYALLPPWLSRVVLILLQVLGPILAEHMINDLRDALHYAEMDHATSDDDSNIVWNLNALDRVQTIWEGQLSTILCMKADLSPSLYKDIDTCRAKDPFCVGITVERVIENGLFKLLPNGVRQIVRVQIAQLGLNSMDVTFAQLRHVMILLKTHMPQIIDYDVEQKVLNEFQEAVFKNLMKDISAHAGETSTVNSLGTVGMHTWGTDQRHYQPTFTVGRHTIPELKARSTKLMDSLLALFFQFQLPTTDLAQAKGLPSIVFEPMPSVWKRELQAKSQTIPVENQGEIVPCEAEARRVLQEALYSNFNREVWLNDEQAEASLINFATEEHALIVTPCGSGKTITFLLPFLLAKTGFIFIIVPYVALCKSMYNAVNERFPGRCLEFRKDLDIFKPEYFRKQSETLSKVRFVIAVTDTAVSIEAKMFLHAASNYRQLNAIVIDEAHQVILSQHFRPVMNELGIMFTYGVKVVLVSGTLPSCLEDSLFRTLRVRKNSVRIVRKDDSYGKRLTVNLLKFNQNATDDSFAKYVISDIVRKRLFRSQERPDKRPILIFVMTKTSTEKVVSALERYSRADELLNVVKYVRLTSESTEEERSHFFQSMSLPTMDNSQDPKLVIGISTSAAGEGVDFEDVGTVVVLGGCYGGTLLLHQMFNRAGRGSIAEAIHHSNAPEVFFLHSQSYILSKLGDYKVNDDELLKFVTTGDRKKAAEIIGFKSLETMMSRNMVGTCGGTIMETTLGSNVEHEPCRKCFGCLGPNWDGNNPEVSTVVNDHRGSIKRCATSVSMGTQARAVLEMTVQPSSTSGAKRARNEQVEVQPIGQATNRSLEQCDIQVTQAVFDFFKTKSAKYCIACGGNCQYPNACDKTKSRIGLSDNQCTNCFNFGHSRCSFQILRSQYKNSEVYYKRIEVTRCIELVKDCTAWKTYKACRSCYLQHIAGTLNCPIPNPYTVRHVIIIVWNDSELMQELAATETSFESNSTFMDFTRWTMYQGNGHLQNAWKLLDFFIKRQKRWFDKKHDKV